MNDFQPREGDLRFAAVEEGGRTFTFLVNNPRDHIQKRLCAGMFYERKELRLIEKHAKGCRRLLDVGANIGNHSVFLAHALDLELAVPIEPQPFLLPVLKANLGLNWRRAFDLSYLGFGLSDSAGVARIGSFDEDNLGGTSLVAGRSGDVASDGRPFDIPLKAADELFEPGTFDLIKIDVEGMELEVVAGMRRMLANFHGVVFVEVADANAERMAEIMDAAGFSKRDAHRRYQTSENWLLVRP